MYRFKSAREYLRMTFGSLLPLFILAHFTHHVITAIAAPLLPLVRSTFTLSYTRAGLLLSAFTLAYGLGHLPSGWLSDRVSPIIMIFIGTAGVGIAGLLFGLAPVFPLLIVAAVLIGLAGSGYHPAASYLIATTSKPEQRGRALGVHVIGGSSSYFLAPLLAGGIAAAIGWRGTFVSLSIPTILLGTAMALLLRRASANRGVEKNESSLGDKKRGGFRFWAWFTSFLVLSALSGSLVGSAIGFIPLVLVDDYGIREETAAGLLAIIYSGGFWVAPLSGYLSDRIGRIRLLIGACAVAVPSVFLLPRIAMGVGMYGLLVLLGVFTFVRMPVSESFIFENAPAKRRATLLGVYFLGSSAGGGIFTPLIGWLSDTRDFQYSFALIALALLVLTIVCGVLLFLLRKEASAIKPKV
jgi:MFS family permease